MTTHQVATAPFATKAEFWRHHLDQCQHSGLSKTAYCKQNGLNFSQLMYWQKQASSLSSCEPVVLPVSICDDDPHIASLIVVRIKSAELHIPCSLPPDYVVTLIRGLL